MLLRAPALVFVIVAQALPAAAAPSLFEPARRDFLVGELPRDLVATDLDDDGRLDVACVRFNLFGPGAVTLLAGDGGGGFEVTADLTAAGGATSVAAGDLNEDGAPDLVTAGFLAGTLGLHLSDGAGGFTFQELAVADPAPFYVAVADLDRDGHDDVVVCGTHRGVGILLRGDGAGNLTPWDELGAGAVPQHVAIGDLDGDGCVDLAFADSDGGQLFVYLNDGAGAFALAQVLTPGASPVWVDIAALASTEPPFVAVALRDDGLARVFQWVPATAELVERGTFEAGTNPQALKLRRGDAANLPGLAIADQTGSSLILYAGLGEPAQTFATQDSPTALTIADWNDDGADDFMLPGFNTESIALFHGDGAGLVAVAPAVEVTGGVTQPHALDWDGDDDPDVAVLRQVDRRVTVLVGDGGGAFAAVDVGDPTPEVPGSLAVTEIDGDGQPDFALGQATAARLWLLTSSAGYARSELTLGAAGSTALISRDLNGDGHADLAATQFLDAVVSVLFADGSGGFLPPRLTPVGVGPQDLTAGDWNGDALEDLACVNVIDTTLTALTQSPAGTFTTLPPIRVTTGVPRAVAAGELTGDERLDLVVAGIAGIEVLAGRGDGTFEEAQTIETAAEFQAVRVADVTADGIPDVVAADALGNGVVVFPGGGAVGHGSAPIAMARAAPLGPQVASGTDRGPVGLAIADFDRTGGLDVAAAARSGDRVSFLFSAVAPPVGIDPPQGPGVPFALVAAPNPFRLDTVFRLDGAFSAQRAVLRIYDASGRLIAEPHRGALPHESIVWDGRDARGHAAPRGVYFYRLRIVDGDRVLGGKLVRR